MAIRVVDENPKVIAASPDKGAGRFHN